MNYFKPLDDGFQKSVFDNLGKSAFNKQVTMAPVNSCVVLKSYPVDLERDLGQYQSVKLFQPPPFLVGGFVGSKICENKSGSFNYSNLLGQIIRFLQPVSTPTQSREADTWRRNQPTFPPSYAQVVSSPKKMADLPSPKIVISSPVVVKSSVSPVSSSSVTSPKENTLSPVVCRTVSESSDSSWASVEPLEKRIDLLTSNKWLSNIVVCVSDSDDSDDDLGWDCVDDYQSENGEVINDFKWNGESLSPISSPVSRTPPTPAPVLDGYESDESDGIMISCGYGYEFDAEEETRERLLAEERVKDANRRWENNLLETTDQTDGLRNPGCSKQVMLFKSNIVFLGYNCLNQQVRFPPDDKLTRIRPMLTWIYAYRTARKGDWERFARDADRFRERIDSTAIVLAPVLDPSHRERIRLRNLEKSPFGEETRNP